MTNIDLKKNDEEPVIKGKAKLSFKEKLKKFWSVPKNRKIVIISTIGLILIALALGLFFIFRPDLGKDLSLDVNKEEKNKLYQSILDGTMVDFESANRHPLGVMVENHTDARPQIGLSAASIVYEAIAEGRITRFLAVYGPRGAETIGPVRSARTYYVDWIRELDGYYAHCGGNYDALELIKQDGILDLDQFQNPSAYWRDYSRKVSSEHTMFTASSKLYGIASDKKYSTENKFIPYKFKDDLAVEKRPAAETISINFGNVSYNIVYKYNPTENRYLREMAGKPHIDGGDNTQLSARNVVVQIVKRSSTVTAINESGWKMDTVGSSEASIFQDGTEIKATWKKDNENSRTRFYNKSTGVEIEFNSGTTWIEVLSPELSFTAQ